MLIETSPTKVKLNSVEKLLRKPYKSSKNLKINIENVNKEEKINDEEINELPYSKAIVLDKRSVFQIFKIFLFQKLEIIYILFG